MAFMNKEHAATIRTNLKKAFPGFKFSVTIHHYSSVTVSLMKSPLNFSKELEKHSCGYAQLNHYYLERYEHSDTLKAIFKVINEGNHDNSDIMTDYFDVGFYVNMNIGQYDKPYEQIKL